MLCEIDVRNPKLNKFSTDKFNKYVIRNSNEHNYMLRANNDLPIYNLLRQNTLNLLIYERFKLHSSIPIEFKNIDQK